MALIRARLFLSCALIILHQVPSHLQDLIVEVCEGDKLIIGICSFRTAGISHVYLTTRALRIYIVGHISHTAVDL
jgi:hypothetical protein